jgi:hypothetical protein
MQTLAVPASRHALTEQESPAAAADWLMHAARHLDPRLPDRTVGMAGQVARALVENAIIHGAPPVTIDVSVTAVVTIEVADHGPGWPAARLDGTGSLAVVVGELTSLWDVTEHDDGSKTVTAMVPIREEPAVPRARKRVRR